MQTFDLLAAGWNVICIFMIYLLNHSMTISPGNRKSIFLIGVYSFVFGFVTWLNGTLISFLKLACQLHSDIEAFFVTLPFIWPIFSWRSCRAYFKKNRV